MNYHKTLIQGGSNDKWGKKALDQLVLKGTSTLKLMIKSLWSLFEMNS